MKTTLKIFSNNHGHGYLPGGKDLLKIAAVLVTFPVSIPFFLIKGKIKECKEKRDKEKSK